MSDLRKYGLDRFKRQEKRADTIFLRGVFLDNEKYDYKIKGHNA